MIILLYGQPAAGKTTVSNLLYIKLIGRKPIRIDGDRWREVTQNKDYSKEGRMRNLKAAYDMAIYLEREGLTPILSFVSPYEELRHYLRENSNLLEVYLHYTGDRGRDDKFVAEFEIPNDEKTLKINTSMYNLDQTISLILEEVNKKLYL